MKTAEEIFSEQKVSGLACEYGANVPVISLELAIVLSKRYAKQVAEQALKDAAERAEAEGTHNEGTIGYCVDRDSILSTPIVTP